MSDDDDDAFFYEEDFGVADENGTADDLAEHVIPSPVWMSYDPDWDMESPTSDYEDYFADEYYDESAPEIQKKQEKNETDDVAPDKVTQMRRPKAKRKLKDRGEIPELKLPEKRYAALEPTVVWRSRNREPSLSPPQEVGTWGCGKKVALLSDWRDRFNIGTSTSDLRLENQLNIDIGNPSCAIPLESNGILEEADGSTTKPRFATTEEEHLQRQMANSDISICKENRGSQPIMFTTAYQRSHAAMQSCVALEFDNGNSKTATVGTTKAVQDSRWSMSTE